MARGKNKLNLYLSLLLIFCLFATYVFGMDTEPDVLTPPVTGSEYFPCSRCHEEKRSALDDSMKNFHAPLRVEGHIEDSYNCYGCHDNENMDRLRLFNGSTIELTVSSPLCGQCHSTNYKLWQSGLHGKMVGNWNGPKKITPCASCHNPHRPAFAQQKPSPPPIPPEQTLRWRK